MAVVATDWTIDRATGNVRYTGNDHGGGSPSYCSVIELHRWVQSLADDAVADPASGDEMDMTNVNPSVRSTDNIITFINSYNIDDTAAEHIYDGSIIQDGGDTIYDGFVNFGPSSVQIQIHQDGAVLSDDWWNYGGGGLNPDATQGISHRFMLKVRKDGVDIDHRRLIGIARTFGNSYQEFVINSTNRGNNVFALADDNDLNNETAEATVATWTTITNTEGYRAIDVDDDSTDEYYYSEWDRDTYSINQFYERMKWLSRAGTSSTLNGLNGELFRGLTHSIAYDGEAGGISVSTNDRLVAGTRIYCPTNSGTFQVGEAVHEDSGPDWKGRVMAWDATNDYILVDIETGTVSASDDFTGQTSSATGTVSSSTAPGGTGCSGCDIAIYAVDDQGSTGNLYGQLLKGQSPVDNLVLYDDADLTKYLLINGAPTERTIAKPFCGASTGSAIIGAYGFCLEKLDLSAADKVFDLTNTPRNPPNNVTNTVSGLASGEDRVLVAPWDGTSYDGEGNPAIDKDQLSLNASLTSDNITSFVTTEAAPHGTPGSGYIRVTDDNGFERRLHYTSFTGSGPTTWNVDTTDGNEDFASVNATAGNDVWLAYIDELASAGTASYTAVHSTGEDDLVVLVRDGGSSPIKEFISAWTFKSTNQTIAAIRNSDA